MITPTMRIYVRMAGAGLIPNPATVNGPRTMALTHRVEESCPLGEPMAS
jgi:hypothetical protein